MTLRHALELSLALTGSLVLAACVPPGEPDQGKDQGKDQATQAETGSRDAIAPTVLCQHVREVAAKDNPDDAELLDRVQRDCVEVLTKLETRYPSFTQCVDAAQTASELARCEQAMVQPPPLLGAASPTARLEQVCDHMLTILQRELPGAGGMSGEEIDKLRAQCVEKAAKEIEVEGAAAFAEKADCILAAQKLADVEGC